MKSLVKRILGAAMVGASFVISIPTALLDTIAMSLVFFLLFAVLAALFYVSTAFEMIFNPA